MMLLSGESPSRALTRAVETFARVSERVCAQVIFGGIPPLHGCRAQVAHRYARARTGVGGPGDPHTRACSEPLRATVRLALGGQTEKQGQEKTEMLTNPIIACADHVALRSEPLDEVWWQGRQWS